MEKCRQPLDRQEGTLREGTNLEARVRSARSEAQKHQCAVPNTEGSLDWDKRAKPEPMTCGDFLTCKKGRWRFCFRRMIGSIL